MTTYQTKPQTVEAVQWRGDNEREIVAFFPENTVFVWGATGVGVYPPADSIEKYVFMFLDDWAVRFNDGEGVRLANVEEFVTEFEEKP